jgi:t-SNARE complex subunit (syntaxin)
LCATRKPNSAYAALADECESLLDDIARQQDRLAALQAAWERVGADAADDDRRAAAVADAAAEIRRMLAVCTSTAERMGRASTSTSATSATSSESGAARAMRANHQTRVLQRIQEAVTRARAAQRRSDVHADLVRRAAADPYAAAQDQDGAWDAGFSARQQAALDESTQDVDARVRDIAKVAASVHELATLFQHLQTLIHSQSALLSSVEGNIDFARQQAEAGVQHLTQAREHQKTASSCTGYCIAVLLLLIAIVTVVAVVRRVQ